MKSAAITGALVGILAPVIGVTIDAVQTKKPVGETLKNAATGLTSNLGTTALLAGSGAAAGLLIGFIGSKL